MTVVSYKKSFSLLAIAFLAVSSLFVACVLSVAASLMISTINALDRAAGALGLVAVGALVGAVVGIGIYVYVKQRIIP
jgi:mannose/fructose/N-acetylgalactosamine-specific phosphotransferase system component IID